MKPAGLSRAFQYVGSFALLTAFACGSSSNGGGSAGANNAGASGAGAAGMNSGGSAGSSGGSAGTDNGGSAGASGGGDGGNAGGGQAGASGSAGNSTTAGASGTNNDGGSAGDGGGAGGSSGTSGSGGAGAAGSAGAGAGGAPPAPDNDLCTAAKVLTLGAMQSIDIAATTLGAQKDVDPPCESGAGPDVFYQFDISKRVFVYADTFGATWNTVLYLLSNDCKPLSASTTSGDAVCSAGACGGSQSQVVALLEAGHYRLGLSGHSGAAGAATIHFQWALAGSGSAAPLPKGDSMQSGTTVGASGNMQGISAQCLAAGPENAYWWANCPNDAGGSLSASTCGAASWESVLALEIPATAPYTCALDSCGLQSSLSANIPAGAGLRVLAVDGQGGTDKGAYKVTVSRP